MTTTGKWAADYVYLNGRPLAKIAPVPKETGPPGDGMTDMPTDAGTPPDKEAFYYYHLDHLGTPLAMTDASKTIVWSSDYYPFGTTLDETVVQSNEFRFPGQYHDRETDLYYNWHRYYEPTLGRYITADPMGHVGGDINLYRYVSNNVLGFTDPSGRFKERRDPTCWVLYEDIDGRTKVVHPYIVFPEGPAWDIWGFAEVFTPFMWVWDLVDDEETFHVVQQGPGAAWDIVSSTEYYKALNSKCPKTTKWFKRAIIGYELYRWWTQYADPDWFVEGMRRLDWDENPCPTRKCLWERIRELLDEKNAEIEDGKIVEGDK